MDLNFIVFSIEEENDIYNGKFVFERTVSWIKIVSKGERVVELKKCC